MRRIPAFTTTVFKAVADEKRRNMAISAPFAAVRKWLSHTTLIVIAQRITEAYDA